MNTSTSQFEQDPPERDVLAGEYVLGVLDTQERARAAQLIDSDPAFAEQVQRWEVNLAVLIEQIPPVPVPDYVWARISSALGLLPAPRSAPLAETALKPGFWNNLGLWRGLGIGGFVTAVVAVLALFSTLRTSPQQPAPQVVVQQPTPAGVPQMVSSLVGDQGRTAYVATMDARTGKMMIMPMQPTQQPGRVPELWIIPKGQAPISMGVVDAQHPAEHTLPEKLRKLLRPDAVLAITMEQPGGSPSGDPTGPPVEKGGITALAFAP